MWLGTCGCARTEPTTPHLQKSNIKIPPPEDATRGRPIRPQQRQWTLGARCARAAGCRTCTQKGKGTVLGYPRLADTVAERLRHIHPTPPFPLAPEEGSVNP
eukprot:scaffold15377_cov65-Isochrysis_galbana.AAC.1